MSKSILRLGYFFPYQLPYVTDIAVFSLQQHQSKDVVKRFDIFSKKYKVICYFVIF